MAEFFVYRPTGESRDMAAVLYDSAGNELAFHVSSSLSWAEHDMQNHIDDHVRKGDAVTWVIGRTAWDALAKQGRLPPWPEPTSD